MDRLKQLDESVGLIPPPPRPWSPEDGPLVPLADQHLTLFLLSGSALLGGGAVALSGLITGDGVAMAVVFVLLVVFLVVCARLGNRVLGQRELARLGALPAAEDAPRGAPRRPVRLTRVLAVGLPLLVTLPGIAAPEDTLSPLAAVALVQVGLQPYYLRRWQRQHGRVLLVVRHPHRGSRGRTWWAPAPDGERAVRT